MRSFEEEEAEDEALAWLEETEPETLAQRPAERPEEEREEELAEDVALRPPPHYAWRRTFASLGGPLWLAILACFHLLTWRAHLYGRRPHRVRPRWRRDGFGFSCSWRFSL